MGYPKKLPMNLTVSVSYNCNSRCKTCNIYKKKSDELSLLEWEKIFKKIGPAPFWVTFSGGEPFLKKDIEQLVCLMYDICSPSIINIPTNGLLVNRIFEKVKYITEHCSKSQIVINVSMDDVGNKHDHIRGVPGSYDKAVEVISKLKSLKQKNLSLGIHTVLSKYNIDRIPDIYKDLQGYGPDSYITEIAEKRVELDTLESDITPDEEDYFAAIDFLIDQLKRNEFQRIGKITKAFRIEYYKLAKRIIKEKKQPIPCYAGFSSGQIAPDGDVWGCCVRAEALGNLRQSNYDLKKIWFSDNAKTFRKSVKNRECYCPLANASYTNMLCDFNSLIKIAFNIIRTHSKL